MHWLIQVGGGAIIGHLLKTHYGEFWADCKRGSTLSRRIYRALESTHNSLGGFPFAAGMGGRGGLYQAIAKTEVSASNALDFGDDLFDLHHDDLEKDVLNTAKMVCGYLGYGTKGYMQETANSGDDFQKPGTTAYTLRERYLTNVTSVLIPELARLMKRIRPFTSPWGFLGCTVLRNAARLRALLKLRPGEAKIPQAPFAPGVLPKRRRRARRTFPQAATSAPAAVLSD